MKWQFPQKPTPWPNKGLRRASINSFGFGGANVHLVLDDALHHLQSLNVEGIHNTVLSPLDVPSMNKYIDATILEDNNEHHDNGPQLLVWSAADKEGIDRYSASLVANHHYIDFSEVNQDAIANLAYTLSEKRNHLAWRAFTLADDVKDLIHSVVTNKIPVMKTKSKPNLAFIFTGQGANWPTMGRRLKVFPIFKNSLQQAQRHFQKLGATWALDEELERVKDSRLHLPEYSQSICTAVQVALVDLLRDWHTLPHAVIGHSSGEIAAAYCTGAISQTSAWTIAYCRGAAVRSLSELPNYSGGMMAVGLSEEDARGYITELFKSDEAIIAQNLNIACINSYDSVTISGTSEYLEALQSVLDTNGVFCRRLNVNIAYHSLAMHKIRQLYHNMMGSLECGTPFGTSPMMISTVTGKPVTHMELQEPGYWIENLVSPVLFKQAITQLQLGRKNTSKHNGISQLLHPIDLVIEVGPHSALKGPLRNIFENTCPGVDFPYLSLLLRDSCGLQTMLTAAGTLFQKGVELNLHQVNSPRRGPQAKQNRMVTDLPPYVFDHTRKYWAEGRLSQNLRFRRFPPHELLGHQVIDWNASAARWQNFISLTSHPWVRHHKVGNEKYST